MTCDDVEATLESHGIEGLSASEERHVARCEKCQQLVHALESLESSLRALPVPPATGRARFRASETPSNDTLDVIAERRAEAARIDWYRALTQVESPPKSRAFGVPKLGTTSRVSKLLALSAAFLLVLGFGLLAAIVWGELASEPRDPGLRIETVSEVKDPR